MGRNPTFRLRRTSDGVFCVEIVEKGPDFWIGAAPSLVRPARAPCLAVPCRLGWLQASPFPTDRSTESLTQASASCRMILPIVATKAGTAAKQGFQGKMIGLLQRVSSARVEVDGEVIGRIERGLMVLVAVHRDDTEKDIKRLAERLLAYRVFPDDQGRMNLNLRDIGGGLLLVPQFTLTADTKKGTRASFTKGAAPEKAAEYFDRLVIACREQMAKVETGRFGANMQVSLTNDGPVTFWLDTGG